jgi:hypothetical protein
VKTLNDSLLFQHYLQFFFDQLGQREMLRLITDIPTTDEEKIHFTEVMKQSTGRVLHIRDSFKKYFDSASSFSPNRNLVPPELQEEFVASQKYNLHFYGLSDAIIIAVPLMNDNENCKSINGIYSAFVATCGIGLISLSAKIPMRAGIDVGIATQIDDNEIYGPALERAYYLESNLAEYPRFLVGNELINYLLWVENQNINTKMGMVAKSSAEYCRGMICQDTDGRLMLDFLGEKIKEIAGNVISNDIIISAYDFVQSQYKKYTVKQNDKLASRYYRLLKYFYSRKNLWGINI